MHRRLSASFTIASLLLGSTAAISACSSDDGRNMKDPNAAQIASAQTTTTTTTGDAATGVSADVAESADSTAETILTLTAPWSDGEVVPDAYRCAGVDASPALSWTGVPVGTKALAVVLIDEDKPDFVHWVVANIDPATTNFLAGSVDPNAVQAENSNGNVGFAGPCPPEGQTHQYSLTLYALDQVLELDNGGDGKAMEDAIYAAAIEAAAITFSA